MRGQATSRASGRTGRALLALVGAPLCLAACAEPSTAPLTMPPATGTPVGVQVGAVSYVVTRARVADLPDGEALRVYRTHQPGFGHDEGLTAKAVAETFCGSYNRGLDPRAQGIYEPLGADWLFPGGCA